MISGRLTKRSVATLGPGRHGDGNGLYLVVDPSGARRWIARVTVKGQKNRQGKPLRTDFGLGGADVVTLQEARARALEYRRMARRGLNPRFNASRAIPTFEEIARQVHIDAIRVRFALTGQSPMTPTVQSSSVPVIRGKCEAPGNAHRHNADGAAVQPMAALRLGDLTGLPFSPIEEGGSAALVLALLSESTPEEGFEG